MKKFYKFIICITILALFLIPSSAYAWEGECGYEGGISSQTSPGSTTGKITYQYQEVSFITGQPIVYTGTLTISKSTKQGSVVATYVYNLANTANKATLVRTIVYNTVLTQADNGQTTEQTSFSKTPTEVIKIGNTTYSLKSYTFTRANIVDAKPAVNYYSGNTWGKKTYQIGTGTNAGTVEVEGTGNFYGYDQYWGNTEVGVIDYTIQSDNGKDKWGGTANVKVTSTSAKKIDYVKNQPDQISFDGGYLMTQDNSSVLSYDSMLPEFDSKGISTDNVLEKTDSLKLETFPSQTRLPVVSLAYLKGYWAENDIKTLFSLGVFKNTGTKFNPQQFITRGEFAAAMANAAKAVPTDPTLAKKTTTTKKNTQQQVVSPFADVSTDSIYFTGINDAYNRGIFLGSDGGYFRPNDNITVAEAVTTFIRALGLENMAPQPNAVTSFRDNDKIPAYARNAVYVASDIGLVQGDDRGYLNPNNKLTNAQAAVMLNRLIQYAQNGISKDYIENIINY
ncbi:MAG: S-layer homology domain-containing protein [Bacillota bacterium]|nr:S-layer homology domain-containing protein [Bacillota bacterium]